MRTLSAVSVILATVLVPVGVIVAGDWSRFHGPNGAGIADGEAPTPVQWSQSQNLKWKAGLPGPGASSPIVVGDFVFVTCYSGYGVDRRDPGDQKNLQRHLVCIDRRTGNTLWEKSVAAVLPEDPFDGMGIPEHGYASHTPVSDGQRVYVFFGKSGALAFDLDGTQLWQTSVGTESDPRRWGSASSPILYKNLLIVTASAESQAIVALNTESGSEVWRQEATGLDGLWGTPTLAKVDEKRSDLLVGVPYEIWGLNPDNGKLRWFCEAMETDQFNSSVVVHDGVAYAIEGRRGGSIAVRIGGKGDVTKTHVVWSGRDRSRFGTPVVHEGLLYFVSGGVANCLDAKTGKSVLQSRLQGGGSRSQAGGQRERGLRRSGRGGFGGGDYSSPVLADGKIYYVRASGEMFVLKADATCEQLAVNRVTDDRENFSATPAISNGELFIRSRKHLYCVADAK
jgi:hypothetical protein